MIYVQILNEGNMENSKHIAELFHTIFCCAPHETDMINYENAKKCCYYLEQTIEDG